MDIKFDEAFLKAFADFKKEVDCRIKALGDRIGNIDRKFDEKIKLLDSLEKNKDSYKEYVDKSRELLSDSVDSIIKSVSVNNNSLVELKSSLSQTIKKVDFLESSIVDISSTIHRVKDDQQDQLSKLVSLQVSLESDKHECKILSNSITFLSDTVAEYNSKVDEDIGYIKTSVQSVAESAHNNKATLAKNTADISSLGSLIKDITQDLIKFKSEIYNEINDSKKSLQDIISSELEDIFIPDVSHFVKEEDVKMMRHEIDLSNLDARNAYAKSSNIEMQTSIHGKKIEAIQLKLTQLELKGQ